MLPGKLMIGKTEFFELFLLCVRFINWIVRLASLLFNASYKSVSNQFVIVLKLVGVVIK